MAKSNQGRALAGRAVVVTRARAQAGDFIAWLVSQGAEPVEFPAIRIASAPDEAPLRRAAESIGEYDWVIFTSVNGVERFWRALEASGRAKSGLGHARTAVIGPATAAALEQRGIQADVIPRRYVAEAVIEALAAFDLRGRRILLPRAHGAREILPERLRELGATVDEVEAYRAEPDQEGARELRQRLDAGQIDAVTFTSSSTVLSFVQAVGIDVGRAIVACIGPITAGTARELGMRVDLVATEHTMAGLSDALNAHFAALPPRLPGDRGR